jgi:hypothetical protein
MQCRNRQTMVPLFSIIGARSFHYSINADEDCFSSVYHEGALRKTERERHALCHLFMQHSKIEYDFQCTRDRRTKSTLSKTVEEGHSFYEHGNSVASPSMRQSRRRRKPETRMTTNALCCVYAPQKPQQYIA